MINKLRHKKIKTINFHFFSQKFANGEEFAQEGKLRNVNGMDVIVNKGSYTIVEKDGSVVQVDYVADENGFRVGKFQWVLS